MKRGMSIWFRCFSALPEPVPTVLWAQPFSPCSSDEAEQGAFNVKKINIIEGRRPKFELASVFMQFQAVLSLRPELNKEHVMDVQG